jgi:hypothetical protein
LVVAGRSPVSCRGHLIELAGYEPDLPEGRWLAVSGLGAG